MINLCKPIKPVILQDSSWLPEYAEDDERNILVSSSSQAACEKIIRMFNSQTGASVRIEEAKRKPGEKAHVQLGSGGAGTVYRGVDTKRFPGRELAIKHICVKKASESFGDSDRVEMMLSREVVLMNQKGIFPRYLPLVHDVWDIRDIDDTLLTRLIIMDRYQTVSEVYNFKESVSSRDMLKITYDLLCVLSNLHKNHVFHRDIKPENIMVNTRLSPVHCIFIDYNAAKKGNNTRISQNTKFQNLHNPPELEGRADFTPAMEIYMLGSVLYWYIAGKIPADFFDSKTDPGWPGLVKALKTKDNLKLYSEEYLDIILKSIRRNPESRYQSTDDMLDDLINTRIFADYLKTLGGSSWEKIDPLYALYRFENYRYGLPTLEAYESSLRDSPYYSKVEDLIKRGTMDKMIKSAFDMYNIPGECLPAFIRNDLLRGPKQIPDDDSVSHSRVTNDIWNRFSKAAEEHRSLLESLFKPAFDYIMQHGVQLFDNTGIPARTIWDDCVRDDTFWDCAIYKTILTGEERHGLPLERDQLEEFTACLSDGRIKISGYDRQRGNRFNDASLIEDILKLIVEYSDGDIPQEDLWEVSYEDAKRRLQSSIIEDLFIGRTID